MLWMGVPAILLVMAAAWHLRASERNAAVEAATQQMMQAAPQHVIYDTNADAKAEVNAAIAKAKANTSA